MRPRSGGAEPEGRLAVAGERTEADGKAHGQLFEGDVHHAPEQRHAFLEGHGGAYCQDCDIAGPATSDDMLIGGVKPWAVDPAAAARLWELSAELTGLDAFA